MAALKRLSVVVLITVSCFAQAPRTFYVDATLGNDSNNGLGSGSAWKTLQKVNQTTLRAGDSVLLKAGSVWREILKPVGSGTSAAPIQIGSYGTGPKPAITGATIKTGWTPESISSPSVPPPSAPSAAVPAQTIPPVSLWAGPLSSGRYADSGLAQAHLATWGAVQTGTPLSPGSTTPSLYLGPDAGAGIPYASVSTRVPFKDRAADFTIGGWLRLKRTPRDWVSLFSFTDHTSNGFRFDVSAAPQRIRGVVWTGTGASVAISADAVVAVGTPYHIVLRRRASSGQLDLFVNGKKQQASAIVTSPALAKAGSFLMLGGSQEMDAQDWFTFDADLTDTEIQDIVTKGLTVAGIHRTAQPASAPPPPPPATSSTVYFSSQAAEPSQVFEDGVRLTRVTAKNLLRASSYFYDTAQRRLYVRTSDGRDAAVHVIETSERDFAIDIRGTRYLRISDIEAKQARLHGVYFEGGVVDVRLARMAIYNNYLSGTDSWSPTANTGVIIEDSEIHNNGGSGIHLSDFSVGWIVRNNRVHHNCVLETTADLHDFTAGIKANGVNTNSITIGSNQVYSNGSSTTTGDRGAGIWIDTVGSNARISGNYVYQNRFHGIFVEVSSNALVDRNIVYRNGGHAVWSVGIAVSGRNGSEAANNNRIVNNTVWTDLGLANDSGIAVYGDGGSGNITRTLVQNNIVAGFEISLRAIRGGENDNFLGYMNIYTHNCLGAERPSFIEWGQNRFVSTYSALESLAAASFSSPNANPIFTAASLQDFTQLPGSPCVDRGLPLSGITDGYKGAAPDMGAFER